MITPFTSGPTELVNKLNEMVRIVNNLENMTGDGVVKVNQTTAGRALSLNVDGLLQRLPKESGGGTAIRIAYCKADALSGSTIDCYLDSNVTGFQGEEVTVYCNISGGNNLNEASRRLEEGDALLVALLTDQKFSETRWFAIEGFQTTEDCDCSELA